MIAMAWGTRATHEPSATARWPSTRWRIGDRWGGGRLRRCRGSRPHAAWPAASRSARALHRHPDRVRHVRRSHPPDHRHQLACRPGALVADSVVIATTAFASRRW